MTTLFLLFIFLLNGEIHTDMIPVTSAIKASVTCQDKLELLKSGGKEAVTLC